MGAFCKQLLSGALPWVKLRQAQGLLRLCERYGAERVNALCVRALAFEVLDVPRLERMLKAAQSVQDSDERRGQVIPLGSRFARDPQSFATRAVPATKDRDGGGAA